MTRTSERVLSAAITLGMVVAGTTLTTTAAQALRPAVTSAKSSLHCGDTITADTTLRADLVDCPGTGLVIGADNITVDLNGHTIDGDNLRADCPGDTDCDVGISNLAGHDGVTVRGGVIRQFVVGMFFTGGPARTRLRHLTVQNSLDVGIIVAESDDTVIEKNHLSGNGSAGVVVGNSRHVQVAANSVSGSAGNAVLLFAVHDATVEQNTVTRNDHGIAAINGSSHVTIRRNAASHIGGSAIDLGEGTSANRVEDNQLVQVGDGIVLEEASGNLVSGNLVTGSGFFGFPDTAGFGIAIDGGDRNKLERNTLTGGRGAAIFVATLDAPTAAEGNIVVRNVANSKQFDGIYVGDSATATVVERNTANRSGRDGIHVDAATTTLIRNVANGNHDLGIEAVRGVIDGGGNQASRNGNPLQCINVAC